jgi:hypothetical protein
LAQIARRFGPKRAAIYGKTSDDLPQNDERFMAKRKLKRKKLCALKNIS